MPSHNVLGLNFADKIGTLRNIVEQIPKPRAPLALRALTEKDASCFVDQAVKLLSDFEPLLGLLLRRKGFLLASGMRATNRSQRTKQALGLFWRANRRAQLHQGLISHARRNLQGKRALHENSREPPETLFIWSIAFQSSHAPDARKHPLNVSVQDRFGLIQ